MIDRKFYTAVWNSDLKKYERVPFDISGGKIYDINKRELLRSDYIKLDLLPKFNYTLEWSYWISGGWSAGWNRKAEEITDTTVAFRNFRDAKEARVRGNLIEPTLTMRNRGRNYYWDDDAKKFIFMYSDREIGIVPRYLMQEAS